MNDVSKDIVTGGDRIVEAIHTPAATTPTLHISNPEVAKIIKESQHAMMLNSNPTIKPLMVTLNTSEQDVPSQIMESFGEQEGDSEQQLISTGLTNVKRMKMMISRISRMIVLMRKVSFQQVLNQKMRQQRRKISRFLILQIVYQGGED